MKKLKVTIKEKEKQISSFNLYNFKEEIVNFMYKRTVAESSHSNMVFYLLLFFLSVKKDNKTLLEDLLEQNIKKIESLNKKLSQYNKLEKGQYGDLVQESGLKEVFQYDVFFTLIVAFKKHEQIEKDFESFFNENVPIKNEYDRLNKLYGEKLLSFFNRFEKNLIEDDRIGYTGESLDLSKSVYRTIKMRSSRRIDITLHKYAEVKKITSESPIVVEVIQCIDPEIIINIWDAYNLGAYVNNVWKLTNETILNNWFFRGLVGSASYDAIKWLRWKLINGRINRKEKNKARIEFKSFLDDKRKETKKDPIQESLVKSVMSSNEYLLDQVNNLKQELTKAQKENNILVDQNKIIKDLKEKIAKLENIEVFVENLDEKNKKSKKT